MTGAVSPTNNSSNYIAEGAFRLLPVFMKLGHELICIVKLALVAEVLDKVDTKQRSVQIAFKTKQMHLGLHAAIGFKSRAPAYVHHAMVRAKSSFGADGVDAGPRDKLSWMVGA